MLTPLPAPPGPRSECHGGRYYAAGTHKLAEITQDGPRYIRGVRQHGPGRVRDTRELQHEAVRPRGDQDGAELDELDRPRLPLNVPRRSYGHTQEVAATVAAACASKYTPAARLAMTSVIETRACTRITRVRRRFGRVFVSPRSGGRVDRLLRKFAVCCSGRGDHAHDQSRSARRRDRTLCPRVCAPIAGH